MRGMAIVASITAALIASCSLKSLAERPEEVRDVFPLTPGSAWIYQGTVKWTRAESGEVVEKALTWKMQVVDTVERGHVTACVLEGHPADLAHFDNGKTPGDYLIVRVGPRKFYLLRHGRSQEALRRLRDQNDTLHGLVQEEELFLDTPLVPGEVFGPAEQVTRQDGSYYWIVEGERRIKLGHIKGVPAQTPNVEYQLAYRTRPDHTEVGFVPGLGITRYKYVHHGTVSEAEVRLVEYQPGKQ